MLQLISVSHKLTTAEERTSLKWKEEEIVKLKDVFQLDGVVAFQTCNRIDILIDHECSLSDDIINYWRQKVKGNLENAWLTIIDSEEDVAKYIMELSTGMHSAIQMDDQIHGQVKKAFLHSINNKWHSTRIERLFQNLNRYYKELVNTTTFQKGSTSLAYNVHKEILKRLPPDQDRKLLIIGAGDMATQVMKYLPSNQYNEVTIANRSMLKALKLAEKYELHAISLDEINAKQNEFNIIINCIGEDLAVTLTDVNKKCIIVDLSDNENFTKYIDGNKLPLINLESLTRVIEKNSVNRLNSMNEINPLVKKYTALYLQWCSQYKLRRSA